MTLTGLIGSTISIQVKMASAIVEQHQVTIKAPSDASGEVLTSMPLTFTAANWNADQAVSYKLKSLGSHTLKSIATSPYYRNSKPEYKETKNNISAQCVLFIGWELKNTWHAKQVIGCAQLQIGANSLSGLGATFTVGKSGGGNTTDGVTFFLKKPDGSNVACDTDLYGVYSFTANQSGVWNLYFGARAGSGAYTGPLTPQNIDLTNPGGYATVSFSTNAIYYVDSGGSPNFSWVTPGTSNSSQTLWTSFSSNIYAEIQTVDTASYSVGGCGGCQASCTFADVSITNTTYTRSCTSPGVCASSGCVWAHDYGYKIVDVGNSAGMPEYVSGTTEWHFRVTRHFTQNMS